jgi:predicted RecA/RadA family phage recombinase
MATNILFEDGYQLDVVCTAPTTPNSGDPVLVGQLPGVALTDERANGETTVKFNGVANLSVQGETNSDAGSAVAVGDILYYDAAETVKINKDTTGVRFGYALGTVGSGATATIPVKIGY